MHSPLLVRVALAALMLSAAACSGDGGGGGGGSGVHGFVSAGLTRDPDFGDEFGGSAVFINQSIPVPDLETADGTCSDNDTTSLGNVTFKDVGETVTLVASSGEIVFDAFLPGAYFGSGDASLWQMGGTVTLEAEGLSMSFPLSGAFTLTSPDPGNDVTLSPTADFTLAWTSSGTTDPIFVTIEQYNFDTDETPFSVTCRFDDDGSGTISSSVLADLSNDPDLDTEIRISKERLTFVEDVPGVGRMVGDGSVSYSLFGTVP